MYLQDSKFYASYKWSISHKTFEIFYVKQKLNGQEPFDRFSIYELSGASVRILPSGGGYLSGTDQAKP